MARFTIAALIGRPAGLASGREGLSPKARAAIQTTERAIDGWLSAGYERGTDMLPVLRTRAERAG